MGKTSTSAVSHTLSSLRCVYRNTVEQYGERRGKTLVLYPTILRAGVAGGAGVERRRGDARSPCDAKREVHAD
jgi:hypothetical protein